MLKLMIAGTGLALAVAPANAAFYLSAGKMATVRTSGSAATWRAASGSALGSRFDVMGVITYATEVCSGSNGDDCTSEETDAAAYDAFTADRTLTSQELNFPCNCSGPITLRFTGVQGITRIEGFDNVSYVPEPASWAIMIAGFGLTGAAMRRRKLPRTA